MTNAAAILSLLLAGVPAPAASSAVAPTAAVSSTPAPASRASGLVAEKAWDSLYLEFAPAKPADYSGADRRTIAGALLAGARGLDGDPVLAVSLAQRAVDFEATAASWMLVGQLNQRLGLAAAAAAAFEQAITLEPGNPAALLARADLALAENDWLLAQQLYQRVPAGHDAHLQAQQGFEKARAIQQEQTQRLALIAQAERQFAAAPEAARTGGDAKVSSTLTNRLVCLSMTTGACGVLRRCAFAEGRPDPTSGCALLAMECPMDESPARVTETELTACLSGLKALGCEAIEPGKSLLPGEAVTQCRVIEQAYGRDSPR